MSLRPQPTSLLSMSRNRPLSAVCSSSKRDSLYRSVLLKNSWNRSYSLDAAPTPPPSPVESVHTQDEREASRDGEGLNAFVFPDPSPNDSENQWLDSLLEALGPDDDFGTEGVSDAHADEDDELLSPLYSPMSSSDDLVDHPDLYSIPVPYPVPYPPVHTAPVPPWFDFAPSSPAPSDSLDANSPLYDDALPYYYVDDMAVPDAIEDISDDESDAPSTPSTQSAPSTPLSPVRSDSDSRVSHASPTERLPLHSRPHVYIDAASSYFYPFHFDSFSPADGRNDSVRAYHSPVYQDC